MTVATVLLAAAMCGAATSGDGVTEATVVVSDVGVTTEESGALKGSRGLVTTDTWGKVMPLEITVTPRC